MTESMISEQPLTVSQLNRQVKFMLETNYGSALVEGEISGLIRPASGHMYFTLKDSSAQMRCAIFKSSLARSKFIPKDGDLVQLRGRVSLYEARGEYQMVAQTIRPAGEGALQAAFLELKTKLEAEGLFAPEVKQALPSQIHRIGVITSSSGAAIHDILTVLERRYPGINVILYPTLVQGKGSAQAIVKAIAIANAREEVDVLIVGRGGGSLEDLWSFNEETVARAIVASHLPIVSAVGHEVDFTIADFVADVRAATPSAAAELLSPDQIEVAQTLDGYEQWLVRHIQQQLKQKALVINHLQNRLRHPGERLDEQQLSLTQLAQRLFKNFERDMLKWQTQIEHQQSRLLAQNPKKHLATEQAKVEQLGHQMAMLLKTKLESTEQTLKANARQLNTVSPLATLDRGYSITSKGKTIMRSTQEITVGEKITTKLADGLVTSVVRTVDPLSK